VSTDDTSTVPRTPFLTEFGKVLSNCKQTAFISIRDIGLFLASARSDKRLKALRQDLKVSHTAFDHLYAEAPQNDPWASGAPQYQYQRRKYDALAGLLPDRPYRRALDLGCGLGLFTERLALRAEEVVGIDISVIAIGCAADRTRSLGNVRFQQGDITALGAELDRSFDLVVIADTIYYLPPPIRDETLKSLAVRLARLLAPDGVLLLVNHYFPVPNEETRLTRRIHRAFQWSPALTLVAEYRRAFFLASLFTPTSVVGSQPIAGRIHEIP
jgi:SAM-dependent methyltransferase